MSDFVKKLGRTLLQNAVYSTCLCAIVHTTDKEYWDAKKLGYIVLFWLGGMMPLKMGQYGINQMILKRMDLPNYNFFYLHNAKALFIDLSINHFFFPFVSITMLYNYFQYVVPHVYTPKPKTVEKFDKLKAETDKKQLLEKEAKIAQDLLKDILRFRIHLSAVSVFWDCAFPRYNMSRQTSKIVTDLTLTGKKIQFTKGYLFGFIWHAYCINKYFEFHH
ncbi:hypothetical protein ABPG74_000069 [Tetrahymena malaccensis]